MCLNIFEEFPDNVKDLIVQELDAGQIDLTSMTAIWRKDKILENVEGFLAIMEFEPEIYIGALYLPIIIMPVYGRTLSMEDVANVVGSLPSATSTNFMIKNNVLFYMASMPVRVFDREKVQAAFDLMIEGAEGVHADLRLAIRQFFNIVEPEEWSYPEPVLPNIKMTPKQMRIISDVLSMSNQSTQKTFTFLMEKWAKAGYIVGTTSGSVVLDVPYGDRTARLATLFPGVSEGLAALQAGLCAYPPLIILFWESLRKYTGFPTESVDAYQKNIRKIAPLRLTRSSAYIEMDDGFDAISARALIKTMKTLALTVQNELIEPPTTSGLVTPKNIEITLESCPKRVQAVYRELLGTWERAGGTIECNKPARIHLKLVTKAHRSGNYAQITRRFTMVSLAGPHGKNPAGMKVGWNLAENYLDCIPADVAKFERKIRALPGFERNKTVTYLWVGKGFEMTHAKLLGNAMIELKNAEQAAS